MLSISNPMKSAGTAVAYYLDQRKEDYYLNGIDKQGRWAGGLAAKFGLQGSAVKRGEFRNVLDAFSPDGQQALVQNAGKTKRDACWDMTFSVPKEVAVLWALSPPATRRLIEQEVQESVQAVLTKAQEVGGISRSGPGGKVKERADLIWARFFEGTSRAQDPQPHVHAVLVNLGRRQDGTFGALYTPNLFRAGHDPQPGSLQAGGGPAAPANLFRAGHDPQPGRAREAHHRRAVRPTGAPDRPGNPSQATDAFALGPGLGPGSVRAGSGWGNAVSLLQTAPHVGRAESALATALAGPCDGAGGRAEGPGPAPSAWTLR